MDRLKRRIGPRFGARRLADDGVHPMVDLLGSHHTDRASAAADAREYQRLAADLADAAPDLGAAISLKPTQLGLDCDEERFRDHLSDVLEAAIDRDVFVWLDMEEHATVDATVDGTDLQVGRFDRVRRYRRPASEPVRCYCRLLRDGVADCYPPSRRDGVHRCPTRHS